MHVPSIEDQRTDSGDTQRFVADRLNRHVGLYRRYEKGQREIPVRALVKLAALYGCSADDPLSLSDARHA